MILCPTRILGFFTPDTISNEILYSIPQYVDLILHVEGIQLINIPFSLYIQYLLHVLPSISVSRSNVSTHLSKTRVFTPDRMYHLWACVLWQSVIELE